MASFTVLPLKRKASAYADYLLESDQDRIYKKICQSFDSFTVPEDDGAQYRSETSYVLNQMIQDNRHFFATCRKARQDAQKHSTSLGQDANVVKDRNLDLFSEVQRLRSELDNAVREKKMSEHDAQAKAEQVEISHNAEVHKLNQMIEMLKQEKSMPQTTALDMKSSLDDACSLAEQPQWKKSDAADAISYLRSNQDSFRRSVQHLQRRGRHAQRKVLKPRSEPKQALPSERKLQREVKRINNIYCQLDHKYRNQLLQATSAQITCERLAQQSIYREIQIRRSTRLAEVTICEGTSLETQLEDAQPEVVEASEPSDHHKAAQQPGVEMEFSGPGTASGAYNASGSGGVSSLENLVSSCTLDKRGSVETTSNAAMARLNAQYAENKCDWIPRDTLYVNSNVTRLLYFTEVKGVLLRCEVQPQHLDYNKPKHRLVPWPKGFKQLGSDARLQYAYSCIAAQIPQLQWEVVNEDIVKSPKLAGQWLQRTFGSKDRSAVPPPPRFKQQHDVVWEETIQALKKFEDFKKACHAWLTNQVATDQQRCWPATFTELGKP